LPGVQAEIKDLLRQSVKAEEPKTYLVGGIDCGRELDFGEES
jgi:plasmid stability protein